MIIDVKKTDTVYRRTTRQEGTYNIKAEIALDIVNSSHRIRSSGRRVYGRNFPCEITLLWRGCAARNVRKKGAGGPRKK